MTTALIVTFVVAFFFGSIFGFIACALLTSSAFESRVEEMKEQMASHKKEN